MRHVTLHGQNPILNSVRKAIKPASRGLELIAVSTHMPAPRRVRKHGQTRLFGDRVIIGFPERYAGR